MFIATIVFVSVYFVMKYFTPSTASETVITVLAIISGVAFWVEYHHNCKINEAQFIMELNNQFLTDDKMAEVEHILEKFNYLVLNKATYSAIENAMKGLRERFDVEKSERQNLVNYLVHLEGIATLVNAGVLRIETISDLMGYRFFIAVNNPVVQELELNPYRDYYRGIDHLYDHWSKKINPMPLSKYKWENRSNNDRSVSFVKFRQRKRDRKPSSRSLYVLYVKRFLDVILAFVFVLLFWWLYIIVAVLVRVNLGSPVLFVQERPGKIDPKTGKEKIFKLYKFRTMTDKKDSEGNLLPDSERLTRFGKILRSTSLDEIPEVLFNVLLFRDMSIVGPRPLLVEYLPYYTDEQRRRHEVYPGITGLAMSTVRNSLGWEKKFELDIEYVDRVSFWLDVKIIVWTIRTVITRKGINEPGEVTNSKFIGNGGRNQ